MTNRHFWLVTVIQRFDAMELEGMMLPARIKTAAEPFHYCPVFESREAAIAWNNGSAEHVCEMAEVEP